jgi:UTP--glucose-1-phosphate uridylyltransferase
MTMTPTSPIRKAVVPVAGLGTRLLPATKSQPKEMLPVGRKPVVQYVVEELERAGVQELCMVTGRSKRAIEDHFDRDEALTSYLMNSGHGSLLEELAFEQLPVRIFYTRQAVPRGLGDAVAHAEHFVGSQSFIVALGDTIIRSRNGQGLAQRLVQVHQREGAAATIAVEEVAADEVHRYGIVSPAGASDGAAFPICDLVEKPPREAAPSRLAIAARYVFSPAIFPALKRTLPDRQGDVQLTDAIRVLLAQGQPVWAVRLAPEERRYDIGNFETYFKAFIDFAADDEKYGYIVRHYIHQMATNGGPA